VGVFTILEDTLTKDTGLDQISNAIAGIVGLSEESEEVILERASIIEQKSLKLIVKEENTKKTETIDEELEVEDSEDGTEEEPLINLTYSTEEEQFLAENFYKSVGVDYEKIMYGEGKSAGSFELEGEYWVDESISTESETMTVQEAESTLKNIQYAEMTGMRSEVDNESRRKFDIWIKFNPAEFLLFEKIYSLTQDVNYQPFV
jgi:flavin-binding protein dodecin